MERTNYRVHPTGFADRNFVGLAASWAMLLILAVTAAFCATMRGQSRLADSPATAGANLWEPVGLSGGGAMFAPAISPVDPDLMLLNCDMGAAYLSENGGHDWRMIHQAQLRSDIRCRPAFHPSDRKIIYASSGGQLRISRDGGKTFSRIGNLNENLGGEIAINPANTQIMLAGTWNGRCLLSEDAGQTWALCNGPEGEIIGFHFCRDTASPGTRIPAGMFAATGKGIWRSVDGGKTWSEKMAGLPWKEVQGFAGGSGASNTVLYCTIRSKKEGGAFRGGVYRSHDLGETWESAIGNGLNTETKKADEWAYGEISQYHQILTTDAKPSVVYVMNTSTGFHPPHFDTVYRSDDAGRTWRATYYMDPRFEKSNVSPDYVTASLGRSLKGGETPFGAAICNTDPERVLLVRNESHITQNGGGAWFSGHTYPASGQKPGPGSAWVCNGLVVTTTWHYYIDPHESNRHYIAYTDIGWARSMDSGKSWIWWDEKTWPPWRNTCYEIAFDPDTPGKMWGAFSDVHDIPNDNIISERHGHNLPGGVGVSLDFGASWKPIGPGLPAKPVTSIVLDSKSSRGMRTLYAGVFDAGVYKSIDDGKSWTLRKNGLGDAENMRVSRIILHRDGTLFAMVCGRRAAQGKPFLSGGVGLYRSGDRGESWQKISPAKGWLYPKDFSVDARNSNVILAGVCDADRDENAGGLYRTDDGGKNWERIGREGPQTFGGYFHPGHENWMYMTLTEGAPGPGLWLTRDNGRKWESFSDLPFSNIQRVEFDRADASRIYVTTFGGSVWRGPAAKAE